MGKALGVIAAIVTAAGAAAAEHDGLLTRDGTRLFPLGCYELPKDDAALEAMAAAGFNIVHCHSRADLDRAHAAGLQAVFPLPLHQGPTEALRERVAAVVDHPALAVWEGPDEVVWNFTAYSGLHRLMDVHKEPGAWWRQDADAAAYAREKAAEIIPNMRAAVAMIHELDPKNRPVWINEAQRSDVYYVRQCLDFVDITGCDIYPINDHSRRVETMGDATDRWRATGRGIPVWMVLQAFSWHELGDYHGGGKKPAYPTFAETRFMAYDVLVHGARGIQYWGSSYLKNEACRASIHAIVDELAALQPFLAAPDLPGAGLDVIELAAERRGRDVNVHFLAREADGEGLAVFVNEDRDPHMGVVMPGLDAFEGRTFHLLYGDDAQTVQHGELIVRLPRYGVKVYATRKHFESQRTEGRDFKE